MSEASDGPQQWTIRRLLTPETQVSQSDPPMPDIGPTDPTDVTDISPHRCHRHRCIEALVPPMSGPLVLTITTDAPASVLLRLEGHSAPGVPLDPQP